AIQRSEAARVTQQAPTMVQRLGISDALDYFADKAHNIPGFRMFTIILGVNPINMSRVERTPANILRGVIEFVPGGALVTQALDNYGIVERVASWTAEQIRSLGMTGSIIRDAIMRFLDSLGWRDIFRLGSVWDRAKRIFTEPIDRIISFARNLITGILRFIREALLRPLARLAEGRPAYDLLKAVLGQDPITGEPYPRNADTLIGGFMKLIGQEEVWQNIKRANAVARAWAWFQGALSGLLGFVRQIPTLFVQALQSLTLADVVLLPRAFAKVAGVFAGFAIRFISWAGSQVMSLLQIIFEVVAPGAMVYIRRAAGAFQTIIRDPIGFVRNLVRAGLLGFRQFAGNFLTHLRTSLIQWLTGSLSGLNLYIPQAFNLREIIKFILSVLGLTWQNIRQKFVRAIGEPAVAALETTFDIVVTLVREGPAAAWEKIQEQITNLRELVMEQIMTFVRDRVVQAAITRLLTSLNPAGAFIQAVIAIYNTIMFFVERLRQIAQVAMSFIDSIAAIAGGVITAAANRVEQTMAGLLTLVISFLARIAGLGRVSDAVVNIVNRVRAPIDRALDRVVEWIVATARRLGRFITGGTSEERVNRGIEEGTAVLNRFAGRSVGAVVLRPLLVALRVRYQLSVLEPVRDGEFWAIDAAASPGRRGPRSNARTGSDEPSEVESRITVGRVVEIRQQRGVADVISRDPYIWFVAQIVEVDATQQKFRWQSTNRRIVYTGVSYFREIQQQKWRFGHESQVRLDPERLEEENQLEVWSDILIARKVLNYRHHGDESQVPPGMNWEHIVEQTAGGAHSSRNLALTRATINNALQVWFTRPYASHDAPAGFEGTGGRRLRDYLRSKSFEIHEAWKKHAYQHMGLTLSWNSSERGRWQELG
ncbi:MAG TPA: hypothetical protein VGD27_09865, partial [Longimicrobiales bacterium]